MKKIWKWIIGIIVVLALFGRGSGGSSNTQSRSVQEVQPAQVIEEPAQEEVQEESAAAETAETAPAEQAASTPSSIPGVSAEFKNAMDEYEAFFDQYVEFMQKVTESNDISMMGKYAEMMSQYAVTMQALEEMGEREMTNAELAYYIEVTSRIEQKLLLVMQ